MEIGNPVHQLGPLPSKGRAVTQKPLDLQDLQEAKKYDFTLLATFHHLRP